MMRHRLAGLLIGALGVVALLSLGPPSLNAANPPNLNANDLVKYTAAVPEKPQTSVIVATVPDLVQNFNLATPASRNSESLVVTRGSPGHRYALTTDTNAMNDGNSTAQSMRSSRQNLAQNLMTIARTPGGDLTVDDDTGNESRASGASTRASPAFGSQIAENLNLPSSG
jgi:hypothetical protein